MEIPGGPTPGEGPKADDEALRRWLQSSLLGRPDPAPEIVSLQRRPVAEDTSYPCEIITMTLAGGATSEIFLKIFVRPDSPSDDISLRYERELRVYRDVLEGANLGTPSFRGSLRSPERSWLALEFVPGDRLHWRDSTLFIAAAAWLARMQAHFAAHPEHLGETSFLIRHDAAFFRFHADEALHAVSQLSPVLAERLAQVLEDYDRNIEVMTRDPATLIHGSFSKHDILVETSGDPPRLCPIDWEEAGLGSPFYDLAFLTDGWKPPTLDRMWDAYRDEFARHRLDRPNWDRLHLLVPCFRLHKILMTLGKSSARGFNEAAVGKLVETAWRLRRALAGDYS